MGLGLRAVGLVSPQEREEGAGLKHKAGGRSVLHDMSGHTVGR